MLVFWHQEDLRIEGNLALSKACLENSNLVPLYILSDKLNLGESSGWWLHRSLESLQNDYAKQGVKLIFRKGNPVKILQEINPEKVFWNKTYSEDEKLVSQELGKKGKAFNGNHLVDIRNFYNKSGKPFTVFTPFYKALLKEIDFAEEQKISIKKGEDIPSDSLKSFGLLPNKKWIKSLEDFWEPGRKGAIERLESFKYENYAIKRDFPAERGTSLLSPHLHFGEVSPMEVWRATRNEAFQRQLAWREFGTAFITHFPETPNENWQKKFDKFPWEENPTNLKKWQQGQTGYPIIDAGMRQLWKEGWMHNRIRMVVASFLIKDLLIHWKEGADWFWDTLVDADLGNNTLGWQWVAGSGPDAAPFFRIFNPILQGEKFDPEGVYVKTYCPELKNLSPKWIHKPWMAPEESLLQSGIMLGETYPYPVVDHKKMREKALAIFKKL
jgi:deoxyribodipyrimidine photo-lyase